MLCSQLTLQPKWRAFSTNGDVRCENGDPVEMVAQLVMDKIHGVGESIANFFTRIGNVFSLAFGGKGVEEVCIGTNERPDRCANGIPPTAEENARLEFCSDTTRGLENLVRGCPLATTTHTHTHFRICAHTDVSSLCVCVDGCSVTTNECGRSAPTTKC